jgi:hypothetical protein
MQSPRVNTTTKLRYTLSIYLALVFSAVFYMSYFYDGSSIANYLCKQQELSRVNDANIEVYSDKMLFGDPIQDVPEEINLNPTSNNEAGFLKTEMIRSVDDALILILTLSAWMMLIPRLNHIRYLSFIYLLLGLYLVSLSFFKGMNGGAMFSELATPAQATRWLPCFAVWILLFYRAKTDIQHHSSTLSTVKYLLIIAASLTFATHGYEAFMEHPKFKDLLYGAFEIISVSPSQTVAITLLKLIGIMDVFLAVAVIFYHSRWKWLLLWMSAWGFLTAISRPIASGDIGIDDAVLRIGNGAIPLIVYLIIHYHFQSQQKSYDQT